MIDNKEEYQSINTQSNTYYRLDEVASCSVVLFDDVTFRVSSLLDCIKVKSDSP